MPGNQTLLEFAEKFKTDNKLNVQDFKNEFEREQQQQNFENNIFKQLEKDLKKLNISSFSREILHQNDEQPELSKFLEMIFLYQTAYPEDCKDPEKCLKIFRLFLEKIPSQRDFHVLKLNEQIESFLNSSAGTAAENSKFNAQGYADGLKIIFPLAIFNFFAFFLAELIYQSNKIRFSKKIILNSEREEINHLVENIKNQEINNQEINNQKILSLLDKVSENHFDDLLELQVKKENISKAEKVATDKRNQYYGINGIFFSFKQAFYKGCEKSHGVWEGYQQKEKQGGRSYHEKTHLSQKRN
jgi:hypothetical protein